MSFGEFCKINNESPKSILKKKSQFDRSPRGGGEGFSMKPTKSIRFSIDEINRKPDTFLKSTTSSSAKAMKSKTGDKKRKKEKTNKSVSTKIATETCKIGDNLNNGVCKLKDSDDKSLDESDKSNVKSLDRRVESSKKNDCGLEEIFCPEKERKIENLSEYKRDSGETPLEANIKSYTINDEKGDGVSIQNNVENTEEDRKGQTEIGKKKSGRKRRRKRRRKRKNGNKQQ